MQVVAAITNAMMIIRGNSGVGGVGVKFEVFSGFKAVGVVVIVFVGGVDPARVAIGDAVGEGLVGLAVGDAVGVGLFTPAAWYSVCRTSVTALTAKFSDCPHLSLKVELFQL